MTHREEHRSYSVHDIACLHTRVVAISQTGCGPPDRAFYPEPNLKRAISPTVRLKAPCEGLQRRWDSHTKLQSLHLSDKLNVLICCRNLGLVSFVNVRRSQRYGFWLLSSVGHSTVWFQQDSVEQRQAENSAFTCRGVHASVAENDSVADLGMIHLPSSSTRMPDTFECQQERLVCFLSLSPSLLQCRFRSPFGQGGC